MIYPRASRTPSNDPRAQETPSIDPRAPAPAPRAAAHWQAKGVNEVPRRRGDAGAARPSSRGDNVRATHAGGALPPLDHLIVAHGISVAAATERGEDGFHVE